MIFVHIRACPRRPFPSSASLKPVLCKPYVYDPETVCLRPVTMPSECRCRRDDGVRALSAETERNLISQRTREALSRLKAEGKTPGRPRGRKSAQNKYKLHPKDTLIRELLKAGVSKRQIARICKADRNTLDRYIRNFIEA